MLMFGDQKVSPRKISPSSGVLRRHTARGRDLPLEGEPAEDLALERCADVAVELGATLDTGDMCHMLMQVRIPHRCEADRLWEDGGVSRIRNTVQRLAPPVVLGDAKPGNY